MQRAVERGGISVREPWEESDENGTVTFATVQTVANIIPLKFVRYFPLFFFALAIL